MTATNDVKHSYLVLYTAYKADDVVLDSVRNFSQQDYPSEKFKICVVGDDLMPEMIDKINSVPNTYCFMVPPNPKRNKALSINYTMKNIDTGYDFCIVMDADNKVDKSFLSEVNRVMIPSIKAVQVQRVPKNSETLMAYTDGLSEKINNDILRNGYHNLGLSCGLVGSGMVLETNLFIRLMSNIYRHNGFDKDLELQCSLEHIRQYYLTSVSVYDEKLSDYSTFVNQKRRWMFAQYSYASMKFLEGLRVFATTGNIDYFLRVVQLYVLPRILLVGSVSITFVVSLLSGVFWQLATFNFAATIIAMLLPIRKEIFKLRFLRALSQVPVTFILMVYALFTSAGASKKFLHTPHKIK